MKNSFFLKLKNQRGSITVDYMFAFFLVSGLSLLIMTFSLTLSVVEVTQYMAYSSSRAFLLGNVSIEKQKKQAEKKFFELKNNEVLAPLYNGGWFSIPNDSFIADYNIPDKYPKFSKYRTEKLIYLFHGVIVGLKANILDFQIPFFGRTRNQDGNESVFFANVTSFLGREPTYDECHNFKKRKWAGIKKLASEYSVAGKDDNSFVVLDDNGC